MKKLIAMLLLACMLLTLASCGKKDKEPAARTFTGEMQGMNLTIAVKENGFELQLMSKEAYSTGTYTRKDNGTYVLDDEWMEEQFGGLTLADCGDGFYKITDSELEKDQLNRYVGDMRLKLVDDSTYEEYMYQKANMTYQTMGEKQILRQEMMETDGYAAEVWGDGTNVYMYEVGIGSYTTQDNGDTKQVSITFEYDTITATLAGDKLMFADFGEEFALSRISDDTYYAEIDGAEAIMRLKANGVAEILEKDGIYNTGSITFEAGKNLEIVGDNEVIMSIKVDGDKLVYGNSEQSYTLTEVK